MSYERNLVVRTFEFEIPHAYRNSAILMMELLDEAGDQIGVQAEDTAIREMKIGSPWLGPEQTWQRHLVKDWKRGGVRCCTHLSVPTQERTQHEAMASGEAREVETGALQAGDPSPALSGGGLDAARNHGQNRTHRRILHHDRSAR